MRVLFCTAPADAAPQLVRSLLEERLIGCGNILPGARSLYWWQGKIEDDAETVLLMETPDEKVGDAMRRLSELHPYDVPKIVALEANAVNEPYLEWLREVTTNG
jgi:periplasmic divalent cation tolerance protein